MKRASQEKGFTLIEMAVAMAIAAVLIIAVVQLALATTAGFRLQQNLGGLQENARFALQTIESEIEAASFAPQPWDTAFSGWSIDALDGFSSRSDRISVRRWSDANCYENTNPVLGADGHPRYFLRETSFFINSGKSLAKNCKYGPDAGQLNTQVNNLGLVEHAEALQFLYAEDSDSDHNADRWVRGGNWSGEQSVKAVRVGLLLATDSSVAQSPPGTIQVLEREFTPPADGRFRTVFESTFAIHGRLK